MVEGGDGAAEVPLGRVQLLDVPRDLLHHLLALLGGILDLPDLTEQLDDGGLGLLQGSCSVSPHLSLTPHQCPHLLVGAGHLALQQGDAVLQPGQALLRGADSNPYQHTVPPIMKPASPHQRRQCCPAPRQLRQDMPEQSPVLPVHPQLASHGIA